MRLAGNAVPFAPVQPSRRLVAGIALSLAVHALIVLSITPAPPRLVAPAPFLVDLRHAEAPQAAGEITSGQPSEIHTPAPAAAQPETPPASERPAPAAAPEPTAPAPQSLLAVPADRYFTSRELDVRAEPVNAVDLVYPVKAYEMRQHGAVVVRMLISEHGVVDSVTVLEATPPGVFEEAALEATRALVFRPAQRHGRNVKSQKTIEVTFDPYESIRPR